ncbi:Translocation protein sec63 [Tuber brumale]|nr:Translocation protein sec63 [Tuber brumale]
MSTDYNYDDKGQFFPYFVLTILGLILCPLTYSTFAPSKQPGISKTPLIKENNYKPPGNEVIEAARRRQKRKERRLKRFTSIVIGWALFAYMAYLIAVTANADGKIWDPYEILGISMTTDEKAIKSHYKKLSLKYHPDKIRPTVNQTLEDLNNHFVELTKAYKALTDEDIRNNFIQYGHPDGKQSFSIGIALPTWIVSEGNNYYVLAVYGLLFGILLPYYVGRWWYGTKKHTKEGVMTESAGSLFRAYDENIDEKKLVEILTTGEEMKLITGGAREKEWIGSEEATIERKIKAAGLADKQMKVIEELDGWRRRALGLLWAYIYRVDLESEKLSNTKLDVAPAAIALNRSFHAIALAYSNTQPVMASMRLNQCLVQAVPPHASPLLQLPHFTNKIVAAVEQDGGKNHWTVQRFIACPAEKRKKLCVGKGLLNDEQYEQAISFAKVLPALSIETAFFKVMGEKYITPASLVNFVVKMRVVPPGSTPPAVDAKDLLDEDPDETDVEALLGRDGKSQGKASDQSTTPLAHAPYFPRDYSPTWHIFLADEKQGKMIVPPQPITRWEKSTDNFAIQTFKLQFQAPPQPGEYTFVMHCVSDSYLGIDKKQNVTLVISDPSKVEQIKEDEEISEPEEDSLAGQMNAMRGGPVKKPKRRSSDGDDDDSSEESDTDGEEADDQSETDTDTDTDEE